MFLTLNTLNGLIGYDDERAQKYVEQLSAVFRYSMQDNTVIKVSEELNCGVLYLLNENSLQRWFECSYRYTDLDKETYILPLGYRY